MILRIFDVFQTIFIDFDTILSFLGLEMEADILVQRDGRDRAVRRLRFLSQIICVCFSKLLCCRKSGFQHLCQNCAFVMVLWETVWGTMCVMTVGSFQLFIKHVTLTCVLHVKVNVLPKTLISMFSVQAIDSSLDDRYGKPVFFQDTQYNCSSLFQTNVFHRFPWIIYVH